MSTLGNLTRLACTAAAIAAFAAPALAQQGIDPAHALSWQENCGWSNWGTAQGHVRVFNTCIIGSVWTENTGWLSLNSPLNGLPPQGHHFDNTSDTDYGVNIDASGNLSGFAWNENTGWTNFSGGALATPPNPARYDAAAKRLRGYIWNENTGWENLDDAVAYVGTSCPTDFDQSGTLAVADVFAFINAWFASDPQADFNGDGALSVQDIFDFITAWFAGC